MTEFWNQYGLPTAWLVGKILLITVPLMIAMAYLTLAERKVIGAMQLRKGPNVVGPFGLLQPFADGLKLFLKETIIPTRANKGAFILAPMVTFVLALVGWAVMPFGDGLVLADINVGILYLFAMSSLGVYGIIMAGWASNSRYAFLGAIRSAAQMVSYEVSIGFVIVTVLLCVGSLNLSDIVRAQEEHWFVATGLFPMFVIFFISALAETNRLPFDLPEAEAELVAGYNVEYSSMAFALFFLGEYLNMILICGTATVLFLGGWLPPFHASWLAWVPGLVWFTLKVCVLLFGFLWVRATFPRYRYDQLMRLGWKVFLPLSLLWVVGTAGYLVYSGKVPMTGGYTACNAEDQAAAKAKANSVPLNWYKVQYTSEKYAHCDSGEVSESFDRLIARMVAKRWGELPELARLVHEDKLFGEFVFKHVGGTGAETAELKKIADGAAKKCPKGAEAICSELGARATQALAKAGHATK